MAKIRHYDFTRRPRKPSAFWMWLARNFAIRPRLKGRRITVVKKNMDGITPPYLLFVTHASMLDFPAMYTAVAPYDANNVVAIDAVRDVGDFFMRRLGCICKRKFVKDLHLIRNMRYCSEKYGSIVCVYPEARYTLDGTEPDSRSPLCRAPLELSEDASICARAFLPDGRSSEAVCVRYRFSYQDLSLKSDTVFDGRPIFCQEGIRGLLLPRRGSLDYQDGRWLATLQDLDFTCTLPEERFVETV